MKDPIRLRDLLQEKLEMSAVMLDYGVSFAFDPKIADEVQFKCPFHGSDNKPSARYYKNTQSAYCWTCQKSWDLLSFIMDKEQLNFVQAIRFLIDRYKVDTSSIPDDPKLYYSKNDEVSITSVIEAYLRGMLKDARKNKIEFEKFNLLCYAYNNICYQFSLGIDALKMAKKLESKLKTLI